MQGSHAVKAAKVKAHVDPADPWRKWLGDEGLHRGNARADEAATRGVEAHPWQLKVFVGVMKERGVAYLSFLARLATFMLAVARRAEAGIKQLLDGDEVPRTIFGRRHMRKRVDVAFHAV